MDDDAGNVAIPLATTGASNMRTGSGTSSMDVDAANSGIQLQGNCGSKACPSPASVAGGTLNNNNNVVAQAASQPWLPPSRLANLQSVRGFPSPTSDQLRLAPTHVVTAFRMQGKTIPFCELQARGCGKRVLYIFAGPPRQYDAVTGIAAWLRSRCR